MTNTAQRKMHLPAAQKLQKQLTDGEKNRNAGNSAPTFVPTLFELELIARHWLKTRLEISLMYFLYEQTGSTESYLDGLAEERMQEIRETLGDERYANFAAEMERQLSTANSGSISERHDSYESEQPWDTEFPDDCDRVGYFCDPETSIAIGSIDEMNGIHSALCTGFEPMSAELSVITKHWLTKYFDTSYYWPGIKESGSAEWRLIHYSNLRLLKLRKALGDESYSNVCAQVDAEFE